jgi:dimethylaniline monooxygenase (N-oxide forming)
MNVAIIGAGIGGLCAIKHCLDANFNVTAFEQTNDIGGNWFYTDDIGVDANGIEVHTSCYKSLKTNLPKESMGFPHFSMAKNDASYIKAEYVMEFLNQYCDAFNLMPAIKLSHQVIKVCPKANHQWEVRTEIIGH